LGSKTKKSSINDIYNRYLKLIGEPTTASNEVVGAKVSPAYYTIQTVTSVPQNVTHLMIPDTQCKPDIDMSYLDWLGQYIADKKPEVIVHIGDHYLAMIKVIVLPKVSVLLKILKLLSKV
jgi:hypothetical protein